ncbi:MAG: alpha-1,2-fucosyltransferase [Rubripirellula sp.]
MIRLRSIPRKVCRLLFVGALQSVERSALANGRRVLLIADNYGRLANRVTRICNLTSIASQMDAVLIDAGFVEHRTSFAAFDDCAIYVYPPELRSKVDWRVRLACFIIRNCYFRDQDRPKRILDCSNILISIDRWNQRLAFNDQDIELAFESPECRMLILMGLYFDADCKSQSIKDDCRQLLAPQSRLARTVDATFSQMQGAGTSFAEFELVGVHIRQGDYRQWLDGRFYFSPSQYANAMRQVQQDRSHKAVKFLICSDETLAPDIFEDLDVYFSGGTPAEDLFCLSRCDLIISTFSSFAYFASFYGDRPILDLSSISRDQNQSMLATPLRPKAWPRLGLPEAFNDDEAVRSNAV